MNEKKLRVLLAEAHRYATLGRMVREILDQTNKRKTEVETGAPRGFGYAKRPFKDPQKLKMGYTFPIDLFVFYR